MRKHTKMRLAKVHVKTWITEK